MTLLIDIVCWKLWHILELLHHRCFNLFGELQPKVIFWWWDPRAHLHLSKRLEVFDRVALHLLFCLPFIFRLLRGDYYVCVHMLVYILVLIDYWQLVMQMISLYYVLIRKKLPPYFLHCNKLWHILALLRKLPSVNYFM